MKFNDLPGLEQCHAEKVLKTCPAQNDEEHRLGPALCGKAVREHQPEISAEMGFLVQETELPEVEILAVLKRWEKAGCVIPEPKG